MAKHWTDDQEIFLKNLDRYRNVLKGKDEKEAKRLTIELAKEIYSQNVELRHRTVQSIVERLPYLDNLLAGVFDKVNYAKKDQSMYAKIPRENNDTIPNLCNTRHSYNGAIR
ncbi:hypothetical protein [Alkalihalobacillus sp. BA299]|uniref:hypothetical protein n=1 Tax=Alkalihalobacillus sp. BA299 TaxID=2815938 RepID=UPI001ADC933D|nr:hypothetical protein [Alkalihalobacillus sp. BA299]